MNIVTSEEIHHHQQAFCGKVSLTDFRMRLPFALAMMAQKMLKNVTAGSIIIY
ncbi:hypothetical protein [Geobacillus proteiniphilus]|uniref:hypothetical protein n=1 Tax=Geobacillus proteiniphilus TaxID=860353 RepID=UPI000A60104F|nr:hypothetical protein [Geobacillus proteiniphilus]